MTTSLSVLLHELSAEAWTRTAVGSWAVRDVVAHLIDVAMRRLSFHRDGLDPPPPPFPIANDRDFARFINLSNADWVNACRRVSPRQLSGWYESVGRELSEFFESMPVDAPGLFGVSWAGEMVSAGWFDTGREFTEQWHHQMQIRESAGAAPMAESAWLHATLLIALRGLPHAYRAQAGRDGDTVTLDVSGDAGGTFTLEYADGAWRLFTGSTAAPTTRVALTDDAAWRLLFNGLSETEAGNALKVSGDSALAQPLMAARSIVI